MTLLCEAAARGVRQLRFPSGEPPEPSAIAAVALLPPLLPRVVRAWSSPEPAAVATAAALGLAATPQAALREVDHGRWAGLKLGLVAAEEPDAFALWLADPFAAPHAGETRSAAFARVAAWLEVRSADPGHTVVVAGATIIRMMILYALGAGPEAIGRIDVEPLARVQLAGDGGRFRLRFASPPPAPHEAP